MRTVLAIDGGGIRGLIPALLLEELEARTGRPTAEAFDLIAGTSTGGLLALALSAAGHDGRPAYRASDLVSLYVREGATIFQRRLGRTITSVGGLLDERYDDRPLEAVLQRYLGERRLSETLTTVVVTAYDIEARQPYFFKTHKAREEPGRDAPLWLAARATAAAPTYFEPVAVPIEGEPGRRRTLVDGGVFANNPAMCAYVEARKLYGDEPMLVVSLGTGEATAPIPLEQAEGWGLAGWARPLLGTVFDGVSDTVDYQLDKLLNTDAARRYHRLQAELPADSDAMDDATLENLTRLRTVAESIIASRRDDLDAVAAVLTTRVPAEPA